MIKVKKIGMKSGRKVPLSSLLRSKKS
jgi:hypothetical protein